jgi:hypothetical protein
MDLKLIFINMFTIARLIGRGARRGRG